MKNNKVLILVVLVAIAYLIVDSKKEPITKKTLTSKSESFDSSEKRHHTKNINKTTDPIQTSPLQNKIREKINTSLMENPRIQRLIIKTHGTKEILLGNADPHSIIENDNEIENYYRGAINIINELSQCLTEKDLCGQRQKLEKMGHYFNPHRTPLHQAMNTSFNIVNLVMEKEYGNIEDIDRDALKKALQIKGSDIPVAAAQFLLYEHPNFSNHYQLIINEIPKTNGKVKVNILTLLSSSKKRGNSLQHEQFLNVLKDTLSDHSDLYTAFETQKNLDSFYLSKKEFLEQAQHTCQLKKDFQDSGMWPSVYKVLKRQANNQGIPLNLKCS